MQRMARELNLSETVFFLPAEDGADVRVRIFTPANELTFAGHPVLGSAFVLGEALDTSALTLETGAGPIPVELERNRGQIVFGRMEQPVPVPEPYEETDALLAALGVPRSGLPVEAYRNGPRHVYVELASEAASLTWSIANRMAPSASPTESFSSFSSMRERRRKPAVS